MKKTTRKNPGRGRRSGSVGPRKPGLGKQITDARRARGWSQAKLGALIGVSDALIGLYERDEQPPTDERLADLCRVLKRRISRPRKKSR